MAQERKKRRIVLASILKPVDDTRMFEKMGVTLAKEGSYDVIIIGYPAAHIPSYNGIRFIPLKTFPRLSFKRLMAKWEVFRKVWKVKPDSLVITTHELLFPAVLLKILLNISIVYDVRENYYRNILHSGSFGWLIRWPLALATRFKEKLLAPSVDYFFLAEQGYEKEFKFYRSGWKVIENKAILSDHTLYERSSNRKLNLLFSGTLSESTGVFQAIELAKQIYLLNDQVRLTIIGLASKKSEQDKIQSTVQMHSFITLIGGDRLVSHHEIVQQIKQADFGILAYPSSSHTLNSHPTKLYEYLGYGLPIILNSKWPWIDQYLKYQPFVFTDFNHPDYPQLLNSLITGEFYPVKPSNVSWESEEATFLASLGNL
ncbi:MAG: hypothetical protein HOP08_00495 [Cyclobacteriaceae bacterium]|nr:hypothetical protein [Cyclobacteriaceae bacterium]